MIDLHTHLLPDWDDGAADQAEADRMIAIARSDGISAIGLTPHVFSRTKHGDSVRGLKGRVSVFVRECRLSEIRFYRGAEVPIHSDMIQHIKDHHLTVNGSDYVFVEFPADHVPLGASELLYQMMLNGLIPIISHPERNAMFARSPEILYELILQGALGQVTSLSLTGGFGTESRKAAEKFLKHGLVQLIASDAHNADGRPPRLSEAVALAGAIVGQARALAMVTTVPAAILKNEPIPPMGKPICPSKRGRLGFFFR